MKDLFSQLIIYNEYKEDEIIVKLSDIFEEIQNYKTESHSMDGYQRKNILTSITHKLNQQIKRLLDLATRYGFDKNLWHDYLTYLLITNENSFTLTCEKMGAGSGSVNELARHDFKIFRQMFSYDFRSYDLEQMLGYDVFAVLTSYKSLPKMKQQYNRNVSEKVRLISDQISVASNSNEIFDIMTEFYRQYGVGVFGLNKAFRVSEALEFSPITNMQDVILSDLIGYESQKTKLIYNTEAFIKGRPANNVLLFGDSGTGKSTSVKAIINQYYESGLRMIEMYKHQLNILPSVISSIKKRNYRFIIYMDDLSFEDFETEYKYLKAVIEGGLENKPDNVLIYATSNRRHLIKESWGDRGDMDELHKSDTMQEKLSLVNRFGVTIYYGKPEKKEFNNIVIEIAKRYPELKLSEKELIAEANMWELSHGGMSGRTAQQFINYLAGKAL